MLKLDVSDKEMLTKIGAKGLQVAKFARVIVFTGLQLKDLGKGVPSVWSQTILTLRVSHVKICEAISRANVQWDIACHAIRHALALDSFCVPAVLAVFLLLLVSRQMKLSCWRLVAYCWATVAPLEWGGGGICNKTAHQIRVRVNACAVHAYISRERMRSACLKFVPQTW